MHNSNKCIIPECYIDSCLVEVLLMADKDFVNHHKGNGKVANEMKQSFENKFCLGIIDEDKEPLDYLKEFITAKENDFLILWKHKNKNHFIIQIRPVIERWVLKICADYNIDVANFGLPNELKPLLKITKSVSSRKDDRIVRLFKEMKNKECKPLIELKNWIEYLKENKENANLDLL